VTSQTLQYYIRLEPSGFYTIRQKRFEHLKHNHPHDVMAHGRDTADIAQFEALLGPVDWRDIERPTE
jgi:hypothetical protein